MTSRSEADSISAQATACRPAEATVHVREEGDAERGLLSRQPDGSYLVTIGNPAVLRFVRDGARVTGVQLEIAGMTFPGERLP